MSKLDWLNKTFVINNGKQTFYLNSLDFLDKERDVIFVSDLETSMLELMLDEINVRRQSLVLVDPFLSEKYLQFIEEYELKIILEKYPETKTILFCNHNFLSHIENYLLTTKDKIKNLLNR